MPGRLSGGCDGGLQAISRNVHGEQVGMWQGKVRRAWERVVGGGGTKGTTRAESGHAKGMQSCTVHDAGGETARVRGVGKLRPERACLFAAESVL